jgi:HD-GYP domain-containing protein (c-di-GMP phosphodiesterase class II)
MITRYAPFLVGAAVGVLYYRTRRERLAIERLGAATFETLLDAIDANSPQTGSHVRRVAEYALILAKAADIDERGQRSIERIALFHDIGKLDGAISDIVSESTKLSAEERKEIMTHPARGAEVLGPLARFYPDLPAGVIAHHERWDGTGYPKGLKQDEIPIAARIVTIADTFDAVTHSRSYSAARSAEAGIQIIEEGRGTQFDPDLADLFLSPPVIADIRKAMGTVGKPKMSGGKRRGRSASSDIPDITFRWRTGAPSLLKQDP